MKGCDLEKWLKVCSVFYALFSSNLSVAQVVGDTTLPIGERSQVTGNPNFQIDGGATRGGNLFHSFEQFSVPTGGTAFFNNAADVQNILTRVTGGSISNVDGVIRANGNANLFLINPNGIIFGVNASLDVGGSFVASTASSIQFADGTEFSAVNPSAPPLLTISVPIGLQFNGTQGDILVDANNGSDSGTYTITLSPQAPLQVQPGKTLALVGGNVTIQESNLQAPGGRVELGGVAGSGMVGLNVEGNNIDLSFPDQLARADVSLRNGSGIYAIGASGSIRMLAQNIDISRSVLEMGIPSTSRLPDTQTADLELNATGSITISESILRNILLEQGSLGSINLKAGDRISLDSSYVVNTVGSTGVGNAGDINITTGSLLLTGLTSYIFAATFGQGNAGSVNINARDTVSLDSSASFPGRGSEIRNTVEGTGVGNAGNINIITGALSLTNATVNSRTGGQGNAGDININARNTVSLAQEAGLYAYTSGEGYSAGSININARDTVSLDSSFLDNSLFLNSGNSGGINITTGALSLTNGSSLSTSTSGQGNAGSVNINARERVSLDGTSPTSGRYNPSSIFTRVLPTGVGQGGNVTITTGVLSLTNGGAVNTSTEGQGNAGRVTIQASDIQISGTAPSYTNVFGEVVNFPSGVTTSVRSRAVGNGGDVTITTGSLSVSDSGRINTTAQGQGEAGNIQIQASDTVLFDGGDAISSLEQGAVGRGGDIDIAARSLSLLNGAQLSAATLGEGNAGNLNLQTETLNIQNQAEVTVSSSGTGQAGSLFVDANQIYLDNQGRIQADTSRGGGNINLRSGDIILRNGSSISTNATGSNIPGGDIIINTDNLVAVPSENSDISANSEDFRGGKVTVRAIGILGIEFREQLTPLSDITATGASSELIGTVEINVQDPDPGRGAAQLPTEVVDATGAIATGCRGVQGSSFVVTGRGGLPPTPQQALGDDPRWRDWRTPAVVSRQPNAPANEPLPRSANPPSTKSARVEATGWVFGADGNVILTASAPNMTSPNRWRQPVNCDGS
jgi:filamentous hemagglutinin family protein